MSKRSARVLIIDDELDKVSPLRLGLRESGILANVSEPGDVEMDDLKAADLVLVDHDLGHFCKSSAVTEVPNGIALCAVLRQHLREEEEKGTGSVSPTGFALFTAKLNHAAYPLTKVARRHLLARQNNLEWVFSKDDQTLAKKVASLAGAIRNIPSSWADGISSFKEISGALGLGKKGLDLEAYERAVRQAHPPIFELTKWSHGIALVRWLLHEILEYPCFLWDSYRVAARLRVSHDAFKRVIAKKSKLAKSLEGIRYAGMLNDFEEPRWWRHGVERLVWDITAGQVQDADTVRASVIQLAGEKLGACEANQPVVCLGKDYLPESKTVDLSEAVRMQLDDWPPFAESAWMRIELVRGNNELSPLVAQQDRERLDA